MNSKGKDRGRLRPLGGVVLARNEWAWSSGSPNAKLGASCAALLGRLQSWGLRQTPSSSPNYGCFLPRPPPGPFPHKLCGAVWSCGLAVGRGRGGIWGGELVTMGICRSK